MADDKSAFQLIGCSDRTSCLSPSDISSDYNQDIAEVIIFRITTRADWDGIVCAALLGIVEDVDRYRFTEPGPFQHGELEVTPEDILANLPYREGCGLWFDHHISNKVKVEFKGAWWVAPSAARVIFEYYGNGKLTEYTELVDYTDRIDAALLTVEEVRRPRGYILVSNTVEGKRFDDEPYWLKLIELVRTGDLDSLMNNSEVKTRCDQYFELNQDYAEAIRLYSSLKDNVLVTDFRNAWHGEPGNRFLSFSLFRDCDIWVKAMDHPNDPAKAHISVAKNIFNRNNPVNIGKMLSDYGGGGHDGAGSCRPLKEDASKVLKEITQVCKQS